MFWYAAYQEVTLVLKSKECKTGLKDDNSYCLVWLSLERDVLSAFIKIMQRKINFHGQKSHGNVKVQHLAML